MKELSVSATLNNLSVVQNFIRANLSDSCSQKFLWQLELIVEEIFVNIAQYAYASKVGFVRLSVHVDDDAVTLTFIDSGVEYNPLSQPEPDVNLPLDARAPGGLGIFLTKKLVDDISWQRIGNQNYLRVTKKYCRD